MPTSKITHSGIPEPLATLFERFGEADACWFSSVRPDGRVHLAPIWHVLYEHRIYVVTRRKSVRAENVRTNPAVSLALADTSNALIIEGVAIPTNEKRASVRPLFLAKYDWDIATDASYDDVLCITPRKVMAWGSHGDGRWTLEDA